MRRVILHLARIHMSTREWQGLDIPLEFSRCPLLCGGAPIAPPVHSHAAKPPNMFPIYLAAGMSGEFISRLPCSLGSLLISYFIYIDFTNALLIRYLSLFTISFISVHIITYSICQDLYSQPTQELQWMCQPLTPMSYASHSWQTTQMEGLEKTMPSGISWKLSENQMCTKE